jgi:hypothetical protein
MSAVCTADPQGGTMPCVDCERNPKLRATVICPDPWREGAAAGQVGFPCSVRVATSRFRRCSHTTPFLAWQSSSGRVKSENKLLTTRARYSPYGGGGGLGTGQKCQVCKKQLVAGGKWCQECAHVRGICYICGKQILDTSMYTHHSNSMLENKKSKAEIEAARPQAPTTKPKKKDADADLDMAERQAKRAAEQAAAAAARLAEPAAGAATTAGQQHIAGAGTQEGDGDFIAAATFTESKAGYAFKKGPRGVGYYKDAAAAPASDAPDAFPKSLRSSATWTELQNADGRVYYYDSASGVTQWDMPSGVFSAAPDAAPGSSAGNLVRECRLAKLLVCVSSRARAQGGGLAVG